MAWEGERAGGRDEGRATGGAEADQYATFSTRGARRPFIARPTCNKQPGEKALIKPTKYRLIMTGLAATAASPALCDAPALCPPAVTAVQHASPEKNDTNFSYFSFYLHEKYEGDK